MYFSDIPQQNTVKFEDSCNLKKHGTFQFDYLCICISVHTKGKLNAQVFICLRKKHIIYLQKQCFYFNGNRNKMTVIFLKSVPLGRGRIGWGTGNGASVVDKSHINLVY
jgi:hypothetical protein